MAFKTQQQMWDELMRTGAVWVSFDPAGDKFDFKFKEWHEVNKPLEWRRILESTPNLEGRVLGGEIILPEGHKAIVKYRYEKRFTSLGNDQKRYFLWCECGERICEITKEKQGINLNEPFIEHLQMPHDVIEYVCFSR
jgi:hypothetical protein